uniref:Glycosyltransferase n=1 Tax=Prevotella sp. GTC17253 TaxID=3236793 RepID=A0AB33J118_9BACT
MGLITQLSILLPTYNCHCTRLVAALYAQCVAIRALTFEILVADDASTDRSMVEVNRSIRQLDHVSYIECETNRGRSGIRNFLVSQSHYPFLLFIDGDLSLDNPHFIAQYLSAQADIAVGGIAIGGSAAVWRGNLRWLYEKQSEHKHTAERRQRYGFRQFRSTNFLVRRAAAELCPFDESIHIYGYEDVLFGKMAQQQGFTIVHIDNPVLLDDFESNALFVQKTEQSLRVLSSHRHQLQDYSSLLRAVGLLRRLRLHGFSRWLYHVFGASIKRRLEGNNSSIFLFNVYKLLFLACLINPKEAV